MHYNMQRNKLIVMKEADHFWLSD